jgi:hypothetical protein
MRLRRRNMQACAMPSRIGCIVRLGFASLVSLFVLSNSAFAHDGDYRSPEGRSCVAYIEDMFNAIETDKYDQSNIKTQKVEILLSGVVRFDCPVFGGHKFEPVTYYVVTTENNQVIETTKPQTGFCVLDDSNNALGLEDEIR